MEDFCHGGGHIVLNEGFLDFVILPDTLAPDYERRFNLILAPASVRLAFVTVVGGHDNYAVIIYPGFLDAIDNPPHAVVDHRKFSIVFRSTIAIGMANMVESIDMDET